MGLPKSNTVEFISKSIKVHGTKYDYSKVNYVNSVSCVNIICNLHGEFSQEPYSHLKGRGCPKCRYLKNGCNRIKSTQKFIDDAIKIHGNIYEYSKSSYCGAHKKLTIICCKHGEFLQSPVGHLHNKHGCPKCNSSKGEILIRKWLNENNINYKEQKTFTDCRNPNTGYPLKFDFYILDKDILIEYDGEQHFRKMYLGKHHKTDLDLQETKKRDKIKNEYVNKKGIKLIRISYNQFKNIDSILEKEIYGC